MHDFIAIGDIVTDAFIRLGEKSGSKVEGKHGQPDYRICLPFAEKTPYEDVEVVYAVGNSPNASVSASRLGLNSALISNIGDDEEGARMLRILEKERVDTRLITKHSGQKSNYHYVLWYGDDRTILVKHEHYEYGLPSFEPPRWIYLSSLGEGTEDYYKEIADYLDNNPETKLAFQPGTYQMLLGKNKLERIYKRTKVFFSNVEEAGRILETPTLGIKELLKRIHGLGPEIVIITDGPKGSYAFDGKRYIWAPIYPDINPPFERTGAGDAFSSTMVSALALGQNLETAMLWGSINSMSVVQEIGAQKGLLSQEEIQEYLKKAPADFRTQEI